MAGARVLLNPWTCEDTVRAARESVCEGDRVCVFVWGIKRGRERERESERERETVCVCERERDTHRVGKRGREREREKESQRDREIRQRLAQRPTLQEEEQGQDHVELI